MALDAFKLTGSAWTRRVSFQRTLADLLGKRWSDGMVPALLLVGTILYFTTSTPGFLSTGNVTTLSQVLAEIGFVALGLTIVMIAGGIDISVGAIYGLTNMMALMLYMLTPTPVVLLVVAVVLAGGLLGACNGALVAYGKTRPFITTLVTLLLFSSVAQYLERKYAVEVATVAKDDALWNWLGNGLVGSVPASLLLLVVVAVFVHIALTRSRFGWRVAAVGSSRTAARRVGANVSAVTFASYVVSGALCGVAGLLQASRLQQTSSTTGVGMEFTVLTAVVLGGVSLTGGRGTAGRAMMGALVVTILSQGFILQNRSQEAFSTALALILLVFAAVDLKWGKNRNKALEKIAVSPGTISLPASPELEGRDSIWVVNDRLSLAEPIGLGVVEGPEDVILDGQGRLYCGDRRGLIWRFSGENFSQHEAFARIGGHPLGMAFAPNGDLVVCVSGMGLYSVTPAGVTSRLVAEVPRSRTKLHDDSQIQLADDLDIAPDGKVYFSDASTRFTSEQWHLEFLESRANGRVLCYEPETGRATTIIKNHCMPNGICVSHDGQSLLINSTNLSRVDRYWLAGPRKGTLEPFAVNLPGLPDNINRASDGGYWLAFAGMRTPVFDLAVRHPGFRRRMIKELPTDEWLVPQMNTSSVIKLDERGEVVDCLWDATRDRHAVITSMREHDGYLYLGGLTNNRVGRIALEPTPSESARALTEVSL
jgi:ribose transport system permease protein